MRVGRAIRTCGVAAAVALGEAAGWGAVVAPPPYQSLRYDEDYRYLGDPAQRSDALDFLKFVPLSVAGGAYVSLGGEVRLRYEHFDHTLWGQGPQDRDGYLLLRTMLHADVRFTRRLRFFSQLKSGVEEGRTGGPRPTDEDRLDLHQAFFEVATGSQGAPSLSLRVGRQEVAFGSSRLVSFREGPNVRQSFDGVRGTLREGTWQVDALALAPVQTASGSFDDRPDPRQKLWGLYASRDFPVLPGGHLDLYYLGLERDAARFDQGTAREKRHSVGVRVWGRHADWDYNWEGVLQFGTFGGGEISAWTVASDTGYTFRAAPLTPRVGLKADIASGDRDPARAELQTFNALFPRGAYFAESALIGPANFFDVHPSVELKPRNDVTLTADWDFLWRESARDGLYGPAVNLLRSGRAGGARWIGSQVSLRADWRPGRHWTLTANAARFYAGDFIRQSGPGRDVDYFSSWITYLF